MLQILARKNAPGIFSAGIRLVSRMKGFKELSIYSHLELRSKGSKDCISSREPKGVSFTPIAGNPDKWDVYEVLDCTMDETQTVMTWASSQIGCGYDWLGIWQQRPIKLSKIGEGNGHGAANKWYCNELIQMAITRIRPVLHGQKISNPAGTIKLLLDLNLIRKM